MAKITDFELNRIFEEQEYIQNSSNSISPRTNEDIENWNNFINAKIVKLIQTLNNT
jgi:hypothetical protein